MCSDFRMRLGLCLSLLSISEVSGSVVLFSNLLCFVFLLPWVSFWLGHFLFMNDPFIKQQQQQI